MSAGTQVDLFLDSLVDAPVKDDQNLMEFPFFSLTKQPRHDVLEYDDGTVKIRVEPGTAGMATIWDKDILIYVCSLINERIERGLDVSQTVSFHVYDFLKVTGRPIGKEHYERFVDSLKRLDATRIRTTIRTGDEGNIRTSFGWLENWKVETKDVPGRPEPVMSAVTLKVSEWMFRAIVKDRKVLTINSDYFQLKMGLERRIYELARKHVGRQPEWWVGLVKLKAKCGSVREIRKFKAELVKIIDRDSLPDFQMELVAQTGDMTYRTKDGREMVRFRPRVTRPSLIDDLAKKAEPKKKPSGPVEPPKCTTSAYEMAREMAPGYDIYAIEKKWQDVTVANNMVLEHPDKAFLGFVRLFVEKNQI